MNDGVKLILDRLKTNPEDFLPSGRFRSVADNLMELAGGRSERLRVSSEPSTPLYFLTDEERQLLRNAWIKCAREQFTVRILETLMAEKPESEYRYYPQDTGGLQIGGPYNTAAVTNSTITAQQVAMQQQMLELELKARARSMKEEFGNPLQNAYNQQAK